MNDYKTDKDLMEHGVGGLKGLPSVSQLEEQSYGSQLASRDFQRLFMPSRDLVQQYAPLAIEEYGIEAALAGFGKSKYDKLLTNANQFDDINEIRAEALSPAAKLFNGFGKFVGTFGTTFLDTILTPIAGLGLGIYNEATGDGGFWEGFWNNPLNKAMASLLEDFEEWMPNYYTEREQNRDWYENIFTANFWGDKVLKNAGFTAGAMAAMGLTGGLTGGIGGGLIQGAGKLMGGVAKGLGATRKTLAAFNKAARIGGQIGAYATNTLVSAAGEAAIESINAFNEEAKLLKGNSDARFQELIDALDPRDSEYYDKLALILAHKKAYDSDMDKLLRDMGNSIFAANIGILSLTNSLEFYRLLRGGYQNASKLMAHSLKANGENIAAKDLLGAITKGQKIEVTNDVNKGAGRIILNTLKNAGSEGFEEGAQNIASNSNQMWAALKMNEVAENMKYKSGDSLFKSRMNPEVREEIHSYMDALSQTWKDQFGGFEKPGWEEVFLGALTGAMGFANITRKDVKDENGNNVLNSNGKKKQKYSITWSGGVAEAIKEAKEDYNENDAIVEKLNEKLNSKEFKDRILHLTSKMDFENQMTEGLAKNDPYQFKNSEIGEIINDALYYRSIGLIDLYKQIIGGLRNIDDETLELIYMASMDKNGETSLSNELIENVRLEYQKQAQQNIEAIDRILDIYDYVDEGNRDMPQEAKEELVYKYARLDNVNKRIAQLELESLKENLVNQAQNNGKNLSKQEEIDLERLKKDKESLEKLIKRAEKNPFEFTYNVLATLYDLEERDKSKSADYVIKKIQEAENIMQIHDAFARTAPEIADEVYELVKKKADPLKRELLDEWEKGNIAFDIMSKEIDKTSYSEETKEKLKKALWNLRVASLLKLDEGELLINEIQNNVEDNFDINDIFGEDQTDLERQDNVNFLKDALGAAKNYINYANIEHKEWLRREAVALKKRDQELIKKLEQKQKQTSGQLTVKQETQTKTKAADQELTLTKEQPETLIKTENKKNQPIQAEQEKDKPATERKVKKGGIVETIYNKLGKRFKERKVYKENRERTADDFELLFDGIQKVAKEVFPQEVIDKMELSKEANKVESYIAAAANLATEVNKGEKTEEQAKELLKNLIGGQIENHGIFKLSDDLDLVLFATELADKLFNDTYRIYTEWKKQKPTIEQKEAPKKEAKKQQQPKPSEPKVIDLPRNQSDVESPKKDEINTTNTPSNTQDLSKNILSPLDEKTQEIFERLYGDMPNAGKIQFAIDNVLSKYMPKDRKIYVVALKKYLNGEEGAQTAIYTAIPVTDEMDPNLLGRCMILRTADGDFIAVGSLSYREGLTVKKDIFDENVNKLKDKNSLEDEFEYVSSESDLYVQRIGAGRIIDSISDNVNDVPGFESLNMTERSMAILDMLKSSILNPHGLTVNDLTFCMVKQGEVEWFGKEKDAVSFDLDKIDKKKGNIYVLIPTSNGKYYLHRISPFEFTQETISTDYFKRAIQPIIDNIQKIKDEYINTSADDEKNREELREKVYKEFKNLEAKFVDGGVYSYYKDGAYTFVIGNKYLSIEYINIDDIYDALYGKLISVTPELLSNPQLLKSLNDSGGLNVVSSLMLGTYGATVVVSKTKPETGFDKHANIGKLATVDNAVIKINRDTSIILKKDGKWYVRRANGVDEEITNRQEIEKATAIRNAIIEDGKEKPNGIYELSQYKGDNKVYNGVYYVHGDLSSGDDDIILIKKSGKNGYWELVENQDIKQHALESIRKKAKGRKLSSGKQNEENKADDKKEVTPKEVKGENSSGKVEFPEGQKPKPFKPKKQGSNIRPKINTINDNVSIDLVMNAINKLDDIEKDKLYERVSNNIGKKKEEITNEDIWNNIKKEKSVSKKLTRQETKSIIDNYINCG